MTKQFLLLILTLFSNALFSKNIQDPRWEAIVGDISKEGDPDDRSELEAAIQAYKNIEDDVSAEEARIKINSKWKTSTKEDIKKDSTLKSLEDTTRYPQLTTPKSIKNATIDLLEKKNIEDFLHTQGVTYTVPAKVA